MTNNADYEALKIMYGELHIDCEAAQAEVHELRAALSAAERRLQDYATVSDYAEELHTARAALERARALVAEWRRQAKVARNWYSDTDMMNCADELAAALGEQ